jgi:dolichol-phosphate mannosyltransferase
VRRKTPHPIRLYRAPLVSKPSVAVVIPAYNEAAGLPGFLKEIDRALSPHVYSLRLIVVDDASSDATRPAIEAMVPDLQGALEVPTNVGHGPTLMTGYRHALAGDPQYVLQVDGDGQFHGSDLRRVLVLLMDDAHAVCGVRRFRIDPWFRMTMSRLVRQYVGWSFSVRVRDPNCPLRGYEASLLRQLLMPLPERCLIPNLYLTILAARQGVPLLEVDVSHRVRRGASAEGTTWRKGALSPVPMRLVRFSFAALRESTRLRSRLTPAGRPRDSAWADQRAPVARR